MNTTLVGRLFWKEYRYQRGLLLGIMAIVLVIQLIVWGMMPGNERNPLATLASIGMVLSAFYALGSTAVMFAGEREDGTDTWLRILPVTSLPVCGSKIAWMLASWLLAMAVGLGTAWLLTMRNPGDVRLEGGFVASLATHGGLMALWGILFSLICRRVYMVIALAAGALVATVGVNSFAPGFAYFALAALIVADVVLGRRWLLTDGEFALDRIGRTVRAFTLEDALATSVEPSLWWKYYRRELWLEWRQCRWAVLGNVLFVGLSLTFVSYLRIPEARQICWLAVFGLIPLISGLGVFRGDQYRERFRFQTNQGVTPCALWFAKQTVWIGLTLLSIGLLFVFWLPGMMSSGRSSTQFYHLHQNLPIPEGFLPTFLYEGMLASPWPFVGITLGFVSLMYAIGQLCSLVFHRSVTATGIAMLGGVFASFWMLVAVMLDVPLAISVVFPCLAMLGLSLWRTSGWLTERNTIRDGVKIAGVAAILLFLSYQSWVIWRILEVDAPGPVAELTALFPAIAAVVYGIGAGFALSPAGMLLFVVCLAAGWWKWGRSVRKRLTLRRVLVTYAALHLLATGGTAWVLHAKWQDFSQQLNAEIVPLRPSQEALATGDLYRRAEELLTAKFPVPESKSEIYWTKHYFTNWESTTDEQKQWLAENEQSLAVLLEATARTDCAPDDYFRESIGEDVKFLPYEWTGARHLLRLKALEAEARGDLAEAWKYHRTGVRMMVHHTRHITSMGRHWVLNQTQRNLLPFDLLRWLKHGEQTPELLEQAARELIEEFQRMPSLRSSYELEAAHAMWTLDGNRLESWISGRDPSPMNIKSALMQFLHATPGERTRAKLLLANVSRHQLEMAEAVQNGAAHAYAPELLTLHHSDFRFNREGRYPAWRDGWRHYEGRYDPLWNKTETTPFWKSDQLWARIPQRNAHLLLQELEFIAARRTVFLQLAAEWTRLKTGKLPANVRELIEAAAERAADPDTDVDYVFKQGVSKNPILSMAEQYEATVSPQAHHLASTGRILIDPVTNRPFELDFTNDIDRKTPKQ